MRSRTILSFVASSVPVSMSFAWESAGSPCFKSEIQNVTRVLNTQSHVRVIATYSLGTFTVLKANRHLVILEDSASLLTQAPIEFLIK